MEKKFFVHKTAEVSEKAVIGADTKIWNYVQIRENVNIGSNCIIGKNVYIDFGIDIGNNCKIQNNCSIYHKAIIEDVVFIGPDVVVTNDKNPRAINPDGKLKSADDWDVGSVIIHYGASIGTGSIILPNVEIGRFALVGAGSIVTESIPDFALAYGNPAKVHGKVNEEGFVTERF